MDSSWPTVVAAAASALAVLGLAILRMLSPTPRKPTESERCFRDCRTRTLQPLPSLLADGGTVSLSVIVPSYNETKRLAGMLTDALRYCRAREKERKGFTFEVIVVDDGSRDGTSECALDFAAAANAPEIRVLTFERNRGKGGAVTQGMLHARGEYLLFADADGATRFDDLTALLDKAKAIERDGLAIAIGSRSHLVSTDAVVKRSALRNFLMRGFHLYVYIVGVRDIEDTQCGFKLFSRAAAKLIFPRMHVEGWIFDVEILILAEKIGIPIAEVQVNWHEVDGSKMSLARDSIVMAVDMLIIRLNYTLGFWAVPSIPRKVE
ncbi:nucleotide-diphospho-sugar transferase [Hyaloraphidium curvatum]|nr:nucleotide-diphospho-sugar transferase [Hyaloraphidium curvatum]